MSKEEVKKELRNNTKLSEGSMKVGRRRVIFSRLKRRILSHVRLVRIGLISILLLLIFLVGRVLLGMFLNSSYGLYAKLARNFIFTPASEIKSIEGLTNVLILGKGGKGHEAPDLTDTIIFASFDHKRRSIKTISLPRDIWIPELRAKINSAYYWGNKKEEGGGLILAKSTVEEIVGKPVHYALVIDFSGFREVVDILGGVDVEVENSFVDVKYPIAGRENDDCGGDLEYKCRYETIKFEKGTEHMDGERALKFVRSRNAEGDEGTDFARAARQQKVIEGVREKLLSWEVISSPKKLIELKDAGLSSIETDITPAASAILSRRVMQSKENITPHVLPEDLLVNPDYSPEYDNLYVFIPKAVDVNSSSGRTWNEVHEWVTEILSGN